jgi:hypothetical protein
MSRGLGWLQRTVLSFLEQEDRHMDTFEITATAHSIKRDEDGNRWVTDAQHASVHRVLTAFAKQGKVVRIGRIFYDAPGRQHWANARFGTHFRINLLMDFRNGHRGLRDNEAEELVNLLNRAKTMGIDWRKPWQTKD